jgi:hypothetical protein
MQTNLPPVQKEDSAEKTKLYFDTYGQVPLEFNATEVTAAIGFFQARGFDNDAAELTAATILKQAKIEEVPVFQFLDQLKQFDGTQLSAIVSEILNNNRPSSSALGYKSPIPDDDYKTRNILA